MYKIFLDIIHGVSEGGVHKFFYQNIAFSISFNSKNKTYLLKAELPSFLKALLLSRSKLFLFDYASYLSWEDSKVSYTRTLTNLSHYLFFKKTFSLFLEEIKTISHGFFEEGLELQGLSPQLQ